MGARSRCSAGACALIIAAGTALAAPSAMADDPLWITQFGSRRQDTASGVATDPAGNVYVVGGTDGVLAGAKHGKVGDTDAFLVKFDADGHWLWKHQPGSSEYDIATAVATDADGNVFVAGNTYGALGGAYNKGYGDPWVIKFDADGHWLWKRQPGSSGSDGTSGVATDAAGNVYVVGFTLGALGGAKHGGVGDADAWVVKFDANGHQLWKRQPGTTTPDGAGGVATDAAGNVYVVGSTRGALGGSNKGGSDIFVLKFDADGHWLWKRQPGKARWDEGRAVAIDTAGNVYVVGSAYNADGGAGGYDVEVIKFDGDGRVIWKRLAGTSADDTPTSVDTDDFGNVYVLGDTSRPFLVRLDADGYWVWQPLSLNQTGRVSDVATDAAGNVYVTGYTSGTLGAANIGLYDAFLMKFAPGGAP
ncbi:MAG: SBBP repeat-containing protein [Rhodospirillales bacterium]|nr:SBBP repeat-containing protein [Rhodospirillales bacterium]